MKPTCPRSHLFSSRKQDLGTTIYDSQHRNRTQSEPSANAPRILEALSTTLSAETFPSRFPRTSTRYFGMRQRLASSPPARNAPYDSDILNAGGRTISFSYNLARSFLVESHVIYGSRRMIPCNAGQRWASVGAQGPTG
jgi:hypothetical protein